MQDGRLFLQPAATAAGTYTTFEAPGAGAGAVAGTAALAINASGEVTGVYADSSGVLHGFVRNAAGLITPFSVTGGGSGAFEGTAAFAINTAGAITGTYIDGSKASHGFVRSAAGVITKFDAPGAGTAANRGTVPMGINDAGQIVGFFSTGSAAENSVYHGFVRAANGAITVLTDPDAGTTEDPGTGRKQGTQAFAINNAGEVTGSFVDSQMNRHAFVCSASGVFTNFDAPDAETSTVGQHNGMNGTLSVGIDSAGDVTGSFVDTSLVRHGFLRSANGAISKIDPAGGVTGSALIPGTWARGYDPAGLYITGFYTDAKNIFHGFVRSESGTISSIDAPGASSSTTAEVAGTVAAAVNDSGEIAGAYVDTNLNLHAFVLTLAVQTQAATPKFTPAGGAYTSPQSVILTDATKGATIYYTLNGSAPSKTNGTKYSAAIPVKATTTVKAIAVASGYASSAVATATYTIHLTAAKPAFSPIAGNYSHAQTVSIADSTSGATIWYTVNGSTPSSTNGRRYSAPVQVAVSETLKAVAVATGYANSPVATAVYKIGLSAAAAPKLSPAAGSYSGTVTVTMTEKTGGASIYYTTNGAAPTTASTKYTAPLKLTKTTTVRAIAAGASVSNSAVSSATYTFK